MRIITSNVDTITIDTNPQNFSPADATTYYGGIGLMANSTTDTNQDFNLGFDCTLVGAVVFVTQNTTGGTSENITFQLRNTTQTTSSSIGTFQSSGASTTVCVPFTFTGLAISVAAADSICVQYDTPTWVTNPVATQWRALLIFKKL